MRAATRKIAEQLRAADVVLEVRDARAPLSSVNPELERLIGQKLRVIVLHKADLANPRLCARVEQALTDRAHFSRIAEHMAAVQQAFSQSATTFVYSDNAHSKQKIAHADDDDADGDNDDGDRYAAADATTPAADTPSASSPAARTPAPTQKSASVPSVASRVAAAALHTSVSRRRSLRALVDQAIAVVKRSRGPSRQNEPLSMLVVGLPNVGKSSLINALRRAMSEASVPAQALSRARAGAHPGVTRGISAFQVASTPPSYVIDTPGVASTRIDDPERGIKLALVSTLRDALVPLETLADALLFYMNHFKQHAYVERFQLASPVDDTQALFAAIRRTLASPTLSDQECAQHFIRAYRDGSLGLFLLDEIPP